MPALASISAAVTQVATSLPVPIRITSGRPPGASAKT